MLLFSEIHNFTYFTTDLPQVARLLFLAKKSAREYFTKSQVVVDAQEDPHKTVALCALLGRKKVRVKFGLLQTLLTSVGLVLAEISMERIWIRQHKHMDCLETTLQHSRLP